MIKPLVEAHEGFDSALLDVVVLLSAGLPLIPVASDGLAVVNEAAGVITGRGQIVAGSSNISVASVLFCPVLIIVNLQGMIVKAIGTHVCEVVLRNIVPHQVNFWWVFRILIHVSKIECVGVPIDRQKSIWVEKDFIKAWRFTFVGGH